MVNGLDKRFCYYDKIWGRYRIQKVINGRKISYGTYDTLEEAILVRDKLMECDWDKKQLQEIKDELGIKSVRRLKT
ncbi:hypothetical protein [Methanobrevibacter sp.]|uniref:hypothetical protein n=1 Tax=Methanobrevibacter sp. TaxID=66852 RepID=UPI00386EAA15